MHTVWNFFSGRIYLEFVVGRNTLCVIYGVKSQVFVKKIYLNYQISKCKS